MQGLYYWKKKTKLQRDNPILDCYLLRGLKTDFLYYST